MHGQCVSVLTNLHLPPPCLKLPPPLPPPCLYRAELQFSKIVHLCRSWPSPVTVTASDKVLTRDYRTRSHLGAAA